LLLGMILLVPLILYAGRFRGKKSQESTNKT
jgi:hypothetical protein